MIYIDLPVQKGPFSIAVLVNWRVFNQFFLLPLWQYARLEARPASRSITWFGYDAAHGTVWMPFYGASVGPAPKTHAGHGLNMSTFNQNAGWWAFNLINQYSDLNFQQINQEVRGKAEMIHQEAVKAVKEWETMDLAEVEKHSNAFAVKKVDEWWAFAWQLIAKYGRLVTTFNESNTGVDYYGQMYPGWWLESPDVGFTLWSPPGPFHGIPDSSKCPKLLSLAASDWSDWSQWSQWSQWAAWLPTFFALGGAYVLGKRHGRALPEPQDHGYVMAPWGPGRSFCYLQDEEPKTWEITATYELLDDSWWKDAGFCLFAHLSCWEDSKVSYVSQLRK